MDGITSNHEFSKLLLIWHAIKDGYSKPNGIFGWHRMANL